MNRDRQIMKDIENKQAQAREEYAKNKSLMGEYKVKEKADMFSHKENNPDEKEENKKENK